MKEFIITFLCYTATTLIILGSIIFLRPYIEYYGKNLKNYIQSYHEETTERLNNL